MTAENQYGVVGQPVVDPTPSKFRRLAFLHLLQMSPMSVNFNEFYCDGEPRLCPDRHILFKANRLLERYLDALIDVRVHRNTSAVRKRMFHVFLKLGHISLLAQDWAKALSAYQCAYQISEDEFWKDPSNYYGMGLVYLHFKEFKLAAEAFSRLLYSFPGFDYAVDVKVRLAVCYHNVDDFQRCLKYYYQALTDARETTFMSKTHIRFNIALGYENSGDLEKAEIDYKEILTEIIGNSPKTDGQYAPEEMRLMAAINRQLGWIEYRKGYNEEGDKKKDHLSQAEKYLVDSQKYEQNSGFTFYYLGRYFGEIDEKAHEAFQQYRASIDKSEANADTWCSIGALYQKQTQPMDALQAFICAVELDPEHSAAWTDLGELYEKNAQFSDALECFRNALKFNSCAPEPLKARILVLEKELNLPAQVPQRPPPSGGNPAKPLPSLKDAWSQPIPSELRVRQEEIYRVREQRYREGSLLWRMGDLAEPLEGNQTRAEPLNQMQRQILNLLYLNKDRIDDVEKEVLDELETKNRLFYKNVDDRILPQMASSLPRLTSADLSALAETGHLLSHVTGDQQPSHLPTELPTTFSLLSKINVPFDTTAAEILDLTARRIERPDTFTPVFEEEVAPPEPPVVPKPEYPFAYDKSQLLRPTPLLIVESRKDAGSIELQRYCESTPIALIRNLTGVLQMDLSLFSTKTLLEVASNDEMEVRTQYRMPSDVNVDELGRPTWECKSEKKFTSITKYAQYQAETFKHSLKEEAEKLRQTGAKYAQQMAENQVGKRRKTNNGEETMLPMKTIKFGTNVDLSDDDKWRAQLNELSKMPPFCRLIAGGNMLSHLGITVLGMNTVQLYMKVPGSRTPAHQENNSFASVNINIGPGDCEWFATPYEYWGAVQDLCKKHKIDFLKGSYWPDFEELLEENIPVYRFTQKAGDLVWVGGGCVHWVQATGWCNNIAWNVGPLTAAQLNMSAFSYEWNKLHSFKSLIPMQHLAWQLAKNVQFPNQAIFNIVRGILIRSLAFCKMVLDFAIRNGKAIKPQPRSKGEVTHYCSNCEVEVFSILFVKEERSKFNVYCVYCAKTYGGKAGPRPLTQAQALEDFIVLKQIDIKELAAIYDNMTMSIVPKSVSTTSSTSGPGPLCTNGNPPSTSSATSLSEGTSRDTPDSPLNSTC